MDNSRQVHQPPAETSNSGQIATIPCSVCHENSWYVRPIENPDSAVLLPFQFLHREMDGKTYQLSCRVCIERDSEPQPVVAVSSSRGGAIDDLVDRTMREAYLAQLIFAARGLAQERINWWPSHERVCVECDAYARGDAKLTHQSACRVGQVLRVIDALQTLSPKSSERRTCQEISTEPAIAAEPNPPRATVDFNEPWTVRMPQKGQVKDCRGYCVVDLYGSDTNDEDDAEIAKRVAACVNACVGVSTDALQALPYGLMQTLLAAQIERTGVEGGAR